MTAYLPDEDIVSIYVDGILIRMDIESFEKSFTSKVY